MILGISSRRGRSAQPRLTPLLLALALATPCGCKRGEAPAPGAAAPPVAAPSARPTMVMRGFALAPQPSAPETPEPSPEPTADYVSLEAARDAVGRILGRVVDLADSAVTMRREPVTFEYWYARATASGWAFHVEVRDTSACPNDALENALGAAGWVPCYGYQTDGPDGGDMGFVARRFFCLIEARWDGGDDSDSTYVPAPGCSVTVTVTPRRSDDLPRWR